MDIKAIMNSSFGLGLANTLITYPASLLIQLPVRTATHPKVVVAFPLFGILSTIIYTYFYYPYRMSHRFILEGLVAMQVCSMFWRSLLLLFSLSQRADFNNSLELFFTHTKDSLITTPINFLIQVVTWYCVILVSNRIALRWFVKSENA